MDDQTTNNTNLPAGVSKPEKPSQEVSVVASATPNEAQEEEVSDDQRPSTGEKPGQLIREIRTRLDQLWEAQRESILATIKNEKLDPAYEQTRKQRREILDEVLRNAEQFWRQTGLLTKWIRDLTREEDGSLLDCKHKFWRGAEDGHEEEKFEGLCRWLEKMGWQTDRAAIVSRRVMTTFILGRQVFSGKESSSTRSRGSSRIRMRFGLSFPTTGGIWINWNGF